MFDEEHQIAKRIEGMMLGQDPRRIILDKAPNTVEGWLKYTTDRIEQGLRMLVELEFIEDPEWAMFDRVPDEDRRQHLARRCIEGLRNYDKHYGKTERFGWQGRTQRSWRGKAMF